MGVSKKPENSVLIKKAALSSAVSGKEAEFTNKQTKKSLKKLIETVNELEVDKITEIYSLDINNNYLVYDSRITLKLGTTEDLENKIYSCLAAIEKLEKANPQTEGEINASVGKEIYFTEK